MDVLILLGKVKVHNGLQKLILFFCHIKLFDGFPTSMDVENFGKWKIHLKFQHPRMLEKFFR